MNGSPELHLWQERYHKDISLPGIYTPTMDPGPSSCGTTVRGGHLRLQLPRSRDLRTHHQQRIDQFRRAMETEQQVPATTQRPFWESPGLSATGAKRSASVPLPVMRCSASREGRIKKHMFSTIYQTTHNPVAVDERGGKTFNGNTLEVGRSACPGHPRDFMLDYRKAIKVATGKPTFHLKGKGDQGLLAFDMMVTKGEYQF